MNHLFRLIFFILIIISCQNQTSNKQGASTLDSLNTVNTLNVHSRFLDGNEYHSHIQLDFATTKKKIEDAKSYILIDKVCAVSVIPDTTWINKQQKLMPEDDWNTIVSDNQYYQQIATDTLEKIGIPTIFAPRDKRYIKFLKNNGNECNIDLYKLIDAWGLILFNGIDNPVLWSSTEIDKEIKEIYKK
jgi:hypothetical protein